MQSIREILQSHKIFARCKILDPTKIFPSGYVACSNHLFHIYITPLRLTIPKKTTKLSRKRL